MGEKHALCLRKEEKLVRAIAKFVKVGNSSECPEIERIIYFNVLLDLEIGRSVIKGAMF